MESGAVDDDDDDLQMNAPVFFYVPPKQVFLITREVLLKSENIAIRISARNRQMCSDDAKTAIQNLSVNYNSNNNNNRLNRKQKSIYK